MMKLYEGAGKYLVSFASGKTVELDEGEMDELEETCKHLKDRLSQIEDKNKKRLSYMEEYTDEIGLSILKLRNLILIKGVEDDEII